MIIFYHSQKIWASISNLLTVMAETRYLLELEVNYAKSYLNIQSFRFSNRITVKIGAIYTINVGTCLFQG